MLDTYRHQGLRKKLVAIIRSKGIRDEEVLDAIGKVPRHFFMDSSFLEHAYEDKAFPIGSGQTISQPYTVAFQTQLLEVKRGEKILEVGTGSGYQSCILLEMGARVYTVERQKKLFEKTRKFFENYPLKPRIFLKDGYQGLPTFAPFDKIIITASVGEIPEQLISQLRTGGFIVAPVGENDIQFMTRITKLPENQIKKETFGTFVFVPMLKEISND